MLLPVNIDADYSDDPQDPSIRLHQQHHDILHAAVNALIPNVVLTSGEWAASDKVLLTGQLGIVSDSGEIRSGNGVDPWSRLLRGTTYDNTMNKDSLVMLASDCGVVGDGKADDSASLQSFLNDAAQRGLVAQLMAGTTVRVTTTVHVPSGSTLDLNGACIVNGATSTTGRLLSLSGVSHVKILNGTLDGAKSSYAFASEQRHNLHIVNSQDITLRDLLSKDAKGDGIYIGDNITGASSNVNLDNVVVTGCHRNGESITAGKNIHHFGCRFSGNGGTSPSAGVDVEPNVDSATLDNITYAECLFDGNLGDGVIIQSTSANPSARQGGITLTVCSSRDNGSNGLYIRYARDVQWLGGELRGNSSRGIYMRDTCVNVVVDTSIVSNGKEGIAQLSNASTDVIADLTIGGYIWGNGTSGAIGTFDGVNLAAVGSRLNFNATAGGKQQRYGLRTAATWSQVSIGAGSRFPENLQGAKVSLADDFGSRTVLSGDLGWRSGRPNATDVAVATRITGDSSDRFSFRQDGRLQWSSGTAAVDVTFTRTSPGTVGVGASQSIRTGHGMSTSRPSATVAGSGACWFDTTLGKPIWSTGTNWVDATGRKV